MSTPNTATKKPVSWVDWRAHPHWSKAAIAVFVLAGTGIGWVFHGDTDWLTDPALISVAAPFLAAEALGSLMKETGETAQHPSLVGLIQIFKAASLALTVGYLVGHVGHSAVIYPALGLLLFIVLAGLASRADG